MDDAPSRPSREPMLFALACVVAGFAFLGTRGLFETDEGRYAEAAREMLATGDWLVPRLQGHPHLTKPPGTYWLIAAGLGLLGRNEWGARIFLGVAFAVAAACVRSIGTVLLGRPAGARAGWAYLAMLYPFGAGSVLTTDTFLAAAVLLSIACSLRSLTAARAWAWHLLAGLALAAALFVKGHAALVPWAAFVAGWAWRGRRLFPGRAIVSWPGVVAGLALGTAWYVWAAANVPGAWDHFVGHEIAGRFTTGADHDPKSALVYAWILPAGALFWWVHAIRGMRREGTSPAGALLLVWAGATLAVFALIPNKMPMYLLPCAAPIALWTAAGAADPASPWPARPPFVAAVLTLLVAARAGIPAYLDAIGGDGRDMRALAASVASADRGRGLTVALLAGKDAHGLDFYRDGAVHRLRATEVSTEHAVATLRDEAESHADRGEAWLLVTQDGPGERKAVGRVLGESAREVAAMPGWKVLEVGPEGTPR